MTSTAKRRTFAWASFSATVIAIALINRFVVRTGPATDALLVVSACSSFAAIALLAAEWPRSRAWITKVTLAACAVSSLTTIVHAPRAAEQDAFWIVAEALALFSLAVLVVRWAPKRMAQAAGAITIIVTSMTFLRVTHPVWSVELFGAAITWTFGALTAAALGMYLRVLDARRAHMVEAARRAQRLEVARDLHDFVAHDVTGIVVQAQAAHVIAGNSPDAALAALPRIEEAGLRALGSLDHTVKMLGNLAQPGEATDHTVYSVQSSTSGRDFGLDELLSLIGRFRATDQRAVHLQLDITGARLPSDALNLAYRVLSEALTNVRRHAAASARVEITISSEESAGGRALRVRVANSDSADAQRRYVLSNARPRGGHGLQTLGASVQAMGGQFSAGPLADEGSGWNVSATIPLRQQSQS